MDLCCIAWYLEGRQRGVALRCIDRAEHSIPGQVRIFILLAATSVAEEKQSITVMLVMINQKVQHSMTQSIYYNNTHLPPGSRFRVRVDGSRAEFTLT